MSNETIDMAAEVQSMLPLALARMREQLSERIEREAQSVAMEEVRKAVRDWTTENLVPEIKAHLETGKEGMLLQAAKIAENLGAAIGKALAENADKSLSSSYVVKDIAEKLFRGY